MTEKHELPSETTSRKKSSTTGETSAQSKHNQNGTNIGNSKRQSFRLKTLGIFAVLFIIISSLAQWKGTSVGPLFIGCVFLVILVIGSKEEIEKAKEKSSAIAKTRQEANETYERDKQRLNIPRNANKITFLKASITSPIVLADKKRQLLVWKDNRKIHFFPCAPDYVNNTTYSPEKEYSILLNKIEYFSKRGEVIRENKISGGGGGGSSIGGAVIGGLIAGGAGAIIGSRKKTNKIKSELITHDTRETFLNFFSDDKTYSLFFDIHAFHIFKEVIPEKEFNKVNTVNYSRIGKMQRNTKNRKNIPNQIRELAKLRDDGIITENEFNDKKKQLLDKIS